MPDDDLTIYTRRPEREAACDGCKAHSRGTYTAEPPQHTCRRAPAVPQSTRDARARAANAVLTERELEIRRMRLAEINAGYA
jgi:hypothetical protein